MSLFKYQELRKILSPIVFKLMTLPYNKCSQILKTLIVNKLTISQQQDLICENGITKVNLSLKNTST